MTEEYKTKLLKLVAELKEAVSEQDNDTLPSLHVRIVASKANHLIGYIEALRELK